MFFLVTCHSSTHFFFQEEDGIRDTSVTGVQTCALPISGVAWRQPSAARGGTQHGQAHLGARDFGRRDHRAGGLRWNGLFHHLRSEERRVGKEWEYWRWRLAQTEKE